MAINAKLMSTTKLHGYFCAYLGKLSLKDCKEIKTTNQVPVFLLKLSNVSMKENDTKSLNCDSLQLKCTLQNNFNKGSRRKGFYCCGDCILTCMPHFKQKA